MKNYNMLMKEIKENLNKWRHIVMMSVLLKLIYHLNAIPTKILGRIFVEIYVYLKIYMERHKS